MMNQEDHLAMIIYSLEPQTTRPQSGEGGNSRGDIEEGLELAEMEDQVGRAAAPSLVLTHLKVLGRNRIE